MPNYETSRHIAQTLQKMNQARGAANNSVSGNASTMVRRETQPREAMIPQSPEGENYDYISQAVDGGLIGDTEFGQWWKESAWRKVGGTINDVVDDIEYGATKVLEGVFDSVIGLFGWIGSWFGADDQWAKDIIEVDASQWVVDNVWSNMNPLEVGHKVLFGEKFAERSYINDASEEAQKWIHGAGNLVGQIAPSVIAAVLTGGASIGAQAAVLGTMSVGAMGNETEAALHDGADLGHALGTGAIAGVIEAGTELASAGLGKVVGKVASKGTGKVAKALGKVTEGFGSHIGAMSTTAGKVGISTFKELGQAAVEEGMEEAVSELLNPLAKAVYKGDAAFDTYRDGSIAKDTLVAFIGGAAGGVMGGAVVKAHTKSQFGTHYEEVSGHLQKMNEYQNELNKLKKVNNPDDYRIIDDLEVKLGQETAKVNEIFTDMATNEPDKLQNVVDFLYGDKGKAKGTHTYKNVLESYDVKKFVSEDLKRGHDAMLIKDMSVSSILGDTEAKNLGIEVQDKPVVLPKDAIERTNINDAIYTEEHPNETALTTTIEDYESVIKNLEEHKIDSVVKGEKAGEFKVTVTTENTVAPTKVITFKDGGDNYVIKEIESLKTDVKDDVKPTIPTEVVDTKPKGHDANLVKKATNLDPNARFVNLKDTTDVVKATHGYIMDTIMNKSDKVKSVSIHQSLKKLARYTFEDFNLRQDKPTLSKNIVNALLKSQVVFKDGKKVSLENLIPKEIKAEILQDFETNFSEMMGKISKTTTMNKVMTHYGKTITRLLDKVQTYRQSATTIYKTLKSIDKLKTEITKVAQPSVSGDIALNEVQILSGVVSIFPKTRGTSLSGKIRENAFKVGQMYTEEKLGGALFGYDPEIKSFLDYFSSTYEANKTTQKVLTIDEIKYVAQMTGYIRKMLSDYKAGKYTQLEETCRNGYAQTLTLKNSIKFNKIMEVAIDKSMHGMGSANNMMLMFGGEHTFINNEGIKMLDQIEIADDKADGFIIDRELKLKDLTKKHKVSEKSFSKKVTINYEGKEIKLQRANLASIYAYAQDTYARAKMEQGGVIIPGNKKTTLKYTQELETTINETLTKEEKAFMDDLVKSYQDLGLDYQEIMHEHTGIRPVLDEVHVPIHNDTDFTALTNVGAKSTGMSANNPFLSSFFKPRVEAFNVPLVAINQIYNFKEYVKMLGAAKYKYQPLQTLIRYLDKHIYFDKEGNQVPQFVMNEKGSIVKNEAIEGSYRSIRQELDDTFPHATKHIKSYLDKASGQVDVNLGSVGKAIHKVSGAYIAYNISSVLKQGGSWFTGSRYVNINDMAKGLGLGIPQVKSLIKELSDNSGTFRRRYADSGLAKGMTLSEINNRFIDAGTFLMSKHDAMVIAVLYKGAKFDAAKKLGLKITDQKVIDEACLTMRKVITRTQSNANLINMSDIRAGYGGKTMAVFQDIAGFLTSDVQMRFDYMMSNIYGSYIANQVYKNANTTLNSSTATDLQIQEAKATIDNMKGYKGRYASNITKAAASTLASALFSTLVTMVVRRLIGKDEWDEWDTKEFLTDVGFDATFGSIPLIGTIMEALRYGNAPTSIPFTAVLDFTKDLTTLMTNLFKGKPTQFSDFFQLAMTGATMFGLPVKNIYNDTVGIARGFNADWAIKTHDFLYGTKKGENSKNLNIALASKDMKSASVYFNLIIEKRTGTVNKATETEMLRLLSESYQVMPNTVPEHFINEKGETISLSQDQVKQFVMKYSKSNNLVSKAINNFLYRNLDDESKARAIKNIYLAYYEVAKAHVIPNYTPTTKLGRLATDAPNIDISSYSVILSNIRSIKATKTKTKKALVMEYLNRKTNLNRAEKLLVLKLSGYSVSDKNETTIINYLRGKGMSAKKAKEFVKKKEDD